MRTRITVMQTDGTIEDKEIDLAPEPGFSALQALLTPLLNGGDLEHVSVLVEGRGRDMFVDESGALRSLPRNEAATKHYRAYALSQSPRMDPEALPAIYGTAVLFHRIVWR